MLPLKQWACSYAAKNVFPILLDEDNLGFREPVEVI